ncbi:hypothetical protein MDAP_000363 [Mitosporidium daphniae]|uniref:Uncharacterized protein n=1 Tax=Mitosporidium daphniae TaxID=1485682 RepID=A0A098VSN0_9MICR|nr:uncharacterized protein DI09_273p20 [Mitosporidium daphniae]XP_013239448.1 uncharacterized protein DI09_118p70 [Mitosporidium daphniae]KGG51794.1 hypothetical protein DI09_273p20 [Mitosporidium daphniae]KGG53012.1 hypothetical protein DI09_118p70 [Mitosporidium daphniae]|eukprot:XP_013238230.1 uncharacterized protein DI09_273p20 [Mitosporidium daphniae]
MNKHPKLHSPTYVSDEELSTQSERSSFASDESPFKFDDHATLNRSLLHLTSSHTSQSEATIGQKLRRAEQALIDAQCMIMEQLSRLQAEEITLQKLILAATPKGHSSADSGEK